MFGAVGEKWATQLLQDYPRFCLWIIIPHCHLPSCRLHVKAILLGFSSFSPSFLFTILFTALYHLRSHHKKTALYLLILHHLMLSAISPNNASQQHSAAIDTMVKLLLKNCAKPCQHLCKINRWLLGQNTQTCVKLLSFWYFFTVKGTIDVNYNEVNYFS